jgi:hypothetical protein
MGQPPHGPNLFSNMLSPFPPPHGLRLRLGPCGGGKGESMPLIVTIVPLEACVAGLIFGFFREFGESKAGDGHRSHGRRLSLSRRAALAPATVPGPRDPTSAALIVFRRLMCPSTGPLLHGPSSAACTAA